MYVLTFWGILVILYEQSPLMNASAWSFVGNALRSPDISLTIQRHAVNLGILKTIDDILKHQFDTVLVFKIIDLGCNIQPPSFFSPNSDGVNDLLIIKNIEHFPEFKLELYNQNGNRVMKQENTYEPWNGQYLNADVPIGDYILVFYKNKSVSNHANSYPLKLLR